MFGVRILLFVVAYVAVIAEIVVGANAPERTIWIIPGGLVITLLLATSIFVLSQGGGEKGTPPRANIFEWLILILAGMGIAAASFYFEHTILPYLSKVGFQ